MGETAEAEQQAVKIVHGMDERQLQEAMLMELFTIREVLMEEHLLKYHQPPLLRVDEGNKPWWRRLWESVRPV